MCQGDVKNTPIELQELYYPLLYECHAFAPTAAAPANFAAVSASKCRVKPLQDCYLSRNTDRIKCPPWGLLGGGRAMVNETRIERNGKDEKLPGKFSQLLVHPGETVTFFTAGGGGYGAPAEREAAAVERDVEFGYSSRKKARKNYLHGLSS